MAETSLRAYVREIDEFIEHDQLDEAIAHARHILQTYPRHLETYRLLGKAYLEAKRFGDAADIFQRVLSAAPDDFVAHVGMSVVREDEGNVDAAIWHMERAFETNPSNAAVQGELRRLIGRRDGLEPHKVRLTRGALARMYANGELYPQAIAELHAALQEDPDRPDLQVLLAEMYWRTNHRAEAGEVASAVLEALPNCREANRILASALHSQGRTEEALTYHRRVAALDPYSALVESIQDDPTRVDPNAVRIEKLAWRPGVAVDTGPSMRGPAGPATPRPSWLDSLGAATATGAAVAASQAQRSPQPPAPVPPAVPPPADTSDEGPIPDWMEAAGWGPNTGEAQEGPVSFSDDELRSLEAGMLPPEPAPESEDGLARADIPEWLKDVAPAEPELEAAEAGPIEAPSAELTTPPGGLEEPRLPQGWTAPPASEGEDDDDWLKAAAADAPALPTWMEDPSPGATATIVTWLGDRSKKEEEVKAAEPEPVSDEAAAPAALPDWLAEESSAEEPPESTAPTPEPGWLSGVAEAAAQGTSLAPEEVQWAAEEEPIQTGMYPEGETPEEPAPEPADLPEWLQTIAGRGGPSPAEPSAASAGPTPEWLQPAEGPTDKEPAGDEAGFAWLRELAESEPPEPKDEAATPEEAPEPSWMAPPVAESSRSALGKSAGPEWLRGIAEPESGDGGETGSVDWLRGIAEPPAEEEVVSEPIPEPTPQPAQKDESAEWLNLLSPSDTQPQPGSTGEWLRLLKQDGVPPAESPAEAPAKEPAPEPAAAGDLNDDQVFDWLEALAAKQGIPAPEAIPPSPALGAEIPPPSPPPAAQPRPIPEDAEAGLDWLEELAAERGPGRAEEATAPPELPSAGPEPWLPAEEAVPSVPEPAAMEPGAAPEAVSQPPETLREAPPPEPEAPDWLLDLVAAAEETVEPEAVEPEAVSDEPITALPAWMLAGGPEEEPTVPPLPPLSTSREVEMSAEPEPAPEPIDELAETWVPPWEQMTIDEPEPPAGTPYPSLEQEEAALDAIAPPQPLPAEPEPIKEEEQPEALPESVAGPLPKYVEPGTDVLEEVPDWLRPAAGVEKPSVAAAPPPEPEEDLEVPDWLTKPAAPAPPEPAPRAVAPPPEPVELPPPPEPEPVPEPVIEARLPEPVAPPSPPPAKAKGTKPDMESKLRDARHALALGDFRRAARGYTAVIKKKYKLAEITSDLKTALDRNPSAADLWQALGDAFMKSDRLEDAIEAYERGVAAA